MSWKYLTRTVKTALLAVFFFQLVSTVERQVFDFLGYMWAPIIGNFFQIIAVILGLFGACQHYRSFIVVYAVWNLLWLGWNIFVICLYLEVGILNRNRERYILTIGTDSKSWWLEHGIGCNITNSSWLGSASTATDTGRPIPPEEYVEGCILQYYYVEVIHAAVQVLLGMVGLGVAVVIIQASLEQEETFVLANDELEFIMIRSRSASSAATTNIDNFHNLAFDRDDSDDGDSGVLHQAFHPLPLPSPRPHEQPPGYGPRPHERPPSYGPRPHERPPSYEASMRNSTTDAETLAASQCYTTGRWCMPSKPSAPPKCPANQWQRGGDQASSGSRHSGRDGNKMRHDPRKELPWVQVAPSVSVEFV